MNSNRLIAEFLCLITAVCLVVPALAMAAPSQDFSVQNSQGDHPLTVSFEGHTNVTNITGYQWSYYQSVPRTVVWTNFSTELNCSFTFTLPGVYYIRFVSYSPDLPEGYMQTTRANVVYVFPLPTPTPTPTPSVTPTVIPTPTPTVTPTPVPTSGMSIVVFRPSSGNWYFSFHNDGVVDKVVHFGTAGDIAATGDVNSDGINDLIIFRPSSGNWYFDLNRDGQVDRTFHFGTLGDVPFVGRWN